jgi:hypothetical protein
LWVGGIEVEENMAERAVVIVDGKKVINGEGIRKGKENIWFKTEYEGGQVSGSHMMDDCRIKSRTK